MLLGRGIYRLRTKHNDVTTFQTSGVVDLLYLVGLGADVISDATLGNLTGPVDTHFMLGHHLYDVVWGNEKFVVVGNGTFDETEVLLSTDGLNWERVSLGKPSRPLGLSSDSAGTLYGVTWNGSTFVSVGERILTSSDGKSWTVTAAFANCVFSVSLPRRDVCCSRW